MRFPQCRGLCFLELFTKLSPCFHFTGLLQGFCPIKIMAAARRTAADAGQKSRSAGRGLPESVQTKFSVSGRLCNISAFFKATGPARCVCLRTGGQVSSADCTELPFLLHAQCLHFWQGAPDTEKICTKSHISIAFYRRGIYTLNRIADISARTARPCSVCTGAAAPDWHFLRSANRGDP